MKPLLPGETLQTVKKGVALRTVDMPGAGVLHLALRFREGAQGDPPGRAGATHLAARMLFEGTLRRDSRALTAALEERGIHYSADIRHEASVLRFAIPRAHFCEALPLLGELLFESTFRPDDFLRLRAQTAANLEKECNDAGVAAGNDLTALLMRGTPQARPPKGTPRSVRGVSLESAGSRRDALLRGGVTAILGGGGGNRETAALLRLLCRFPASGPSRPPLSAPNPAPPGIYFHPWPGAVQSELRVGAPGPKPGGEDWFPSLLLNTLLGGKFTSRLNLNLREAHGFTYVVRSYFQERLAFSCFCVSAAVATGVTMPALREMCRELDGMASPDVDSKEVGDAAGYLAGSFHYALDNPALYLSRVVEREVLGLPASHFQKYLRFLGRARRQDLSGAPRAHFDPSKAVVVVVGDPSVRSELSALGMPVRSVKRA